MSGHRVSTANHSGQAGESYPDIRFIRERILIADVARHLGIEVKGYRAHCWRSQNHRNADADPSIRFHKKKNRGRCFVCDEHMWSNIDLVMMVLGLDIRQAVDWLDARYFVPVVTRGKHITKREHWNPRYRVGTSSSNFELLIRSGFWATLSPAQQAILPVLDVFAEPATGIAEISYRGMMRFAGIGSPSTIRSAISRYQQLHLLEIQRRAGTDGFRACNRYLLTFDNPRFLELLNEIHKRQTEEIELARAFRAEERRRRRKERSLVTCIGKNSLH